MLCGNLYRHLDGGEGRHLQAAALRIRRPLRVLRCEPRQPLLLQRCWALPAESAGHSGFSTAIARILALL